jgi:oxaloacetate decarboxylase beta subunit
MGLEFLWTGIAAITWKEIIMYCVGIFLIYLAIAKKLEPTLLLPMGFGAILVNIPFSGALTQGDTIGAIEWLFEVDIHVSEILPLLLFIAMFLIFLSIVILNKIKIKNDN